MTDFLLRAVHSLLCLVNHYPELRCWALGLEMKQLMNLGRTTKKGEAGCLHVRRGKTTQVFLPVKHRGVSAQLQQGKDV